VQVALTNIDVVRHHQSPFPTTVWLTDGVFGSCSRPATAMTNAPVRRLVVAIRRSCPQPNGAYYRDFFYTGKNYRGSESACSDLRKQRDTVGNKCVRVGNVCVPTWGFVAVEVGNKCVDNASSGKVIHSLSGDGVGNVCVPGERSCVRSEQGRQGMRTDQPTSAHLEGMTAGRQDMRWLDLREPRSSDARSARYAQPGT
jgi:hypothetical protein